MELDDCSIEKIYHSMSAIDLDFDTLVYLVVSLWQEKERKLRSKEEIERNDEKHELLIERLAKIQGKVSLRNHLRVEIVEYYASNFFRVFGILTFSGMKDKLPIATDPSKWSMLLRCCFDKDMFFGETRLFFYVLDILCCFIITKSQ